MLVSFASAGNQTCNPDPLMHFPFAHHYNDIQCHKVQGTAHGETFLELSGGYVTMDGHGDYVSVSNAGIPW